jgi:hypothetical protein
MNSRQTRLHAKSGTGSELLLQETRSDAPILPVDGIERLHAIRPDRVDWVFDQTQAEAEHRRREDHRVNTFIFVERSVALACAALIGVCGIGGGLYAALHGHDWLGGTVVTVSIGTLAVAFLRGQ